MKDQNAAYGTLGDDCVGLSSGVPTQPETATYVHSPYEQVERQRILVVEDDPSLAALEAGILSAHGYTVIIVSTGGLAIATLHNFIPDLVVLDFELTGSVSGWDVLQALRALCPPATIPVLFTSSATSTVRKYIRTRGETKVTLDHLPKPYPMQALLKRVKRMLKLDLQ